MLLPSLDGSVKAHVTFPSVVSLAEIFNSQRCILECTDTVPSVAVDKSIGCQIWLSRAGMAQPPDIITSSVSELNLQIPGKTDEDDPVSEQHSHTHTHTASTADTGVDVMCCVAQLFVSLMCHP